VNVPALLLLAVVWSSATVVATLGAPEPQDPAVKKFSHAQHVGQVWFNLQADEVWRDCRGCHRFDAQNAVSAPQRECDACHLPGNLGKQYAEGWEQDLGRYATATRDAFRHHTHDMLECRECHLPVNLVKVSDFDIVTGAGQCARCHEPSQVAKNDFAELKAMRWFRMPATQDPQHPVARPFTPPQPAQFAQYVETLAKVFAGPTGGINNPELPVGGDFDHYDHGGIACAECHADIPRAAAAEVGTGAIKQTNCGSCHQADAQGTAAKAAPSTQKVVRPLWSLGAFSHADHYRFLQPGAARRDGVANEAAYAAIAREGAGSCGTCHISDPDAIGLVDRDFPFKDGKSKHEYLACITCHDVPGWKTGETARAPLHDSSDGSVEDGKSGWGECARCHDFGAADFVATRPTVAVARQTERTFQFATHTHPDITTPGIARSGRPELASCKDCHRARVQELPSRIERRMFRHDTHLPAQPTAQDCAQCHPAASTAADAPLLGGSDGRTYSLQSCSQCHLGGEVKEVDLPAALPSRQVVAFPHGPHVAAGASCTDCHEPAAGGQDYATKSKALDCSQCHDHAAGGPKAERLFDDEVKSCAVCHHQDAAGKPAALAIPARRGSPAAANDPRHRCEQTVFGGFADTQFHPLDRACADCHRAVLAPDVRWPGLRVPRKDHLFATSTSPHAGAAAKEPEQCLRCHWKPMDGGRFEAAVFGRDEELMRLRRQPSGAATRARFGNDPKGYPGTPQAGG